MPPPPNRYQFQIPHSKLKPSPDPPPRTSTGSETIPRSQNIPCPTPALGPGPLPRTGRGQGPDMASPAFTGPRTSPQTDLGPGTTLNPEPARDIPRSLPNGRRSGITPPNPSSAQSQGHPCPVPSPPLGQQYPLPQDTALPWTLCPPGQNQHQASGLLDQANVVPRPGTHQPWGTPFPKPRLNWGPLPSLCCPSRLGEIGP